MKPDEGGRETVTGRQSRLRGGSGIFRKTLLAILVASLIPLAGLGILAVRGFAVGGDRATERSKEALDAVTARALALRAVEVADEIADFLREREADLAAVALLPRTDAAYGRFCAAHAREIWRLSDGQEVKEALPLYREIAYIDARGDEVVKVVGCRAVPSSALQTISDPRNTTYLSESYFARAARLGAGEVYVSRVTGFYVSRDEFEAGRRFEGVVRYAAPQFDQDGGFDGLVMLALDARHIEEFTAHVAPTGDEPFVVEPDASTGSYAYVIDDQGYTIAHPTDYLQTGLGPSGEMLPDAASDDDIGLMPPRLDKMGFADRNLGRIHGLAVRGEAGSTQYRWAGHDKFVAYAPIRYYGGAYQAPAGFGWVGIAASVEEFHEAAAAVEREIAANTRRLVRDALFVVGVAAAFVSMTAYVLARTITGPLHRLIEAARALERDVPFENDSLADVTRRNDETAQLARVFGRMAMQIQARQARLKHQVEEMRIEVNELRRSRTVAGITSTDYFRELEARAEDMRASRARRSKTDEAGE